MPCKPQHATSSEILRGAARRLTATKFRAADSNETCGSNSNGKKKILISKNLDNVNKIWHAVALVIENSLLSAARGVRIESLGTFTLDGKDRERFFVSSEFVASHRLLKYDACTGASLAGGSVNARLNISRVAATAGSSRPEAERVLDAVLRSLRQCLASGRSVALSFHPVAEFSCAPSSEARMRYLPGFRAKRKAVMAAVVRDRVGLGRTKSTPTPWAAATSGAASVTPAAAAATAVTDAAAAAAAAASVTENASSSTTTKGANSRVGTIRGPGFEELVQGGTTVGIRRPYSASISASDTNRIVSDRPKSSHDGRRGILQASIVSGADGRALVDEHVVDTAKNQPRAWEFPRKTRHIEENIGGLKTTAYNSCMSLGSDVSSNGEPDARCVSSDRGANGTAVGIDACNGGCRVWEEEWLANLLRQQTLTQTSEEGLLRLTGTLRLIHANSRGCDSRLSGRTLIQALRDVGVKLTSGELADITSVFQRQRDGRVSMQALLAAIGCHQVPSTPAVENAPGLSPTRVRRSREGGFRADSSPLGIRRTRDGRISGTPRQEGSPTLLRGRNGEALSAASCNESRAHQNPAEMVAGVREHENRQLRCKVEKQHLDDGYQDVLRSRDGKDCSSAFPHDNIADTTLVVSPALTPARVQPRRECWNGIGEGGSKAKASSAESAIAELATIVYSPPRSLEGLIHVLQASKVCLCSSTFSRDLCPSTSFTSGVRADSSS